MSQIPFDWSNEVHRELGLLSLKYAAFVRRIGDVMSKDDSTDRERRKMLNRVWHRMRPDYEDLLRRDADMVRFMQERRQELARERERQQEQKKDQDRPPQSP